DVILMLPGWRQSAQMFYKQYDDPIILTRYRIIALNYRGYTSTDSIYGTMRMDRLAKDVHDFIEHMGIRDIIAVGHSMGCSVWWNYVQNYGTYRIRELIF